MTTEQAPGTPANQQTYGLPAGWYDDPLKQARKRFWDGSHWTSLTSHSKHPVSGQVQQGALSGGFAYLADWVGRMLMVNALVYLGWLGLLLWYYTVVSPYSFNGNPLDLAAPGSAAAGDVARPLGIMFLVAVVLWIVHAALGLVTGILWLVWQARLASACPGQLRRGAGGQVISWFIPIVSYWWPYQNVNDLWRGYGRTEAERHEPAPGIVGLWWLSFFVPSLVVGATFASLHGTPLGAASGRVCLGVGIALVGGLVSALLAAGVVKTLSWRALTFYSTEG